MEIESLISARWLVTVDPQDTVLEQHTLAIQDGRILDILPIQQAEQNYQPRQRLHLEQHALLPGLVNVHTHAAMALLKGLADDLPLMEWLEQHIWPAEARWASEEYVYQGTRLAIAEMLRSGTTCFNDMYFFPEAAARAVEESGIRAALGMILIDFPTAYAANADEYLDKARALHQQLAGHSRIHLLFAPHAPYTVSDEPLQKLAALADELQVPVHMHVHETAFEVLQAEQQGERPLARLQRLGLLDRHFLAVHMTQLTDAEIELAAQQGLHIAHCPESNLKLASGFCPTARLLAAGVNVALGTDGNASNNDLDLFGEMRTAALLGKGVAQDATTLPAAQVLRMATLNGARALGLEQQIGSLETGKSADLIAVDLGTLESRPLYDPVSQLVYCAGREQVTHAWVTGRLLLEQRQLTTLDTTELLAEADDWQQRLSTGEQHD
ncbi:MAG: TRZ/ATZ family hydrolase [Thiolinea sp.]